MDWWCGARLVVLIRFDFSGPEGVSHWIHPHQREEFDDLKVLIGNYRAIRAEKQVILEFNF